MSQALARVRQAARQRKKERFAYHAVPTNYAALAAFRAHVLRLWMRTLRRRSQTADVLWEQMKQLGDRWLPKPHILHPWPEARFAVNHPR